MNNLALVIEDDSDLGIIFKEALEAAGYQAENLDNGAQARRRLTEIVPHLVVLDMHLPSISGGELLNDIRTDPRLAECIVIIATADARMGEAYRESADYVLIKPITYVQLRDLAQRLHGTET